VPIFFGTSGVTTMNAAAYDRLKAHLGLRAQTRTFWRALQYALLDEEVMARFHSDGRPLIPGPPPSALGREIAPDRFVDAWGIIWQSQLGNHYYDIACHPLEKAGLDDLEHYAWPDLANASRFAGLKQRAQAIQRAGQAVVALSGISPFEFSYLLRGMDHWFLDLGGDHEFVHALMRKLTDLMRSAAEKLLEEAGDYIDVLVMGDDLGSQKGPLLSTAMYRQLIKPYHAELISAVKARTKARIFYHSDGNIYPLLAELIEIGIDLLNPVHVSARDMGDTARFETGVRRPVGLLRRDRFAVGVASRHAGGRALRGQAAHQGPRPGGGYILAAVHCIQPDVPPENVCAMFDEAVVAGRYPWLSERNPMLPKERVIAALEFKTPDRIPVGETGVDYPITEAALAGPRSTGPSEGVHGPVAGPTRRIRRLLQTRHVDLARRLEHDVVPAFLVPSRWKPVPRPEFISDYRCACRTACLCLLARERGPSVSRLQPRGQFRRPGGNPFELDESQLELVRHVVRETGDTHFILGRPGDGVLPIMKYTLEFLLAGIDRAPRGDSTDHRGRDPLLHKVSEALLDAGCDGVLPPATWGETTARSCLRPCSASSSSRGSRQSATRLMPGASTWSSTRTGSCGPFWRS